MRYSAVLALLVLAGCGLTPQGDFARKTFAETSLRAAKGGLENAEFYQCQLAPIGAVRDRYGKSVTLSQAYKAICEGEPDVNIMTDPSISP